MRYLLFLMSFFLSANLSGQIFSPVKWTTSYKQVNEREFDLIFTATIDEGWVVYSQYLEGDDGPVPTSFIYEEGDHFELIGKNKESGNKKESYDKVFEMNLIKLYKKGIFTQRVKVNDMSKPISGYLEFMTCNDERCLPPTEEAFAFKLERSLTKETKGGAKEKSPQVEKGVDKGSAIPGSKAAPPRGMQKEEALPEAEESSSLPVQSGILDPVQWELAVRKTAEGEYELVFTANMDKGWNIYSQHTDDNGPVPTYFGFDEGDHYELIGKVEEKGKKKEGPDPLFGNVIVIKYIQSPVVFTQRIKVLDIDKPLSGFLEFMTCDDKQCLPPGEVVFEVNFADLKAVIGEDALSGAGGSDDNPEFDEASLLSYCGLAKPDLENPAGQCGVAVTTTHSNSIWKIFILGFLGGLIALLTPCVFPMIPLTVSFFTKTGGSNRKGLTNALLYGLFIFLIYLLLSAPFHLMDSVNPDILNDISTNIWLNTAFFAIFIFFAFSFFGYYELTLPSSWTNKVSSAEGVGGIIGIFFMALTLALVSFSCTGPILGSLLAGALSSDGGAWQLSSGMAGFGMALALPFGLFAAFPGWMNNLPKSGGWLNTVKVVLGFLEVALAFKFLSNADLVKDWGLLKIEPFLGIWLLTFAGLGLYLLGKIKFPHDSPIVKLSVGRIVLGLASLAFVVYLATGFIYDEKAGSYRPLKLLSGLAPPVCYSWLHPCDCPQNLNCFNDICEGLAYARKVNKPIMIDFTGHACVNCRKMEEHVWPEKKAYDLLKDDYVLISLYVDEKIELPEDQQITVKKATGGERKLRNYGHKWSHFQTEYFNTNSQPYYVLLSPGGQLLNTPVGYTPDAEEYADFLKCGLDAFKQLAEGAVGSRQ